MDKKFNRINSELARRAERGYKAGYTSPEEVEAERIADKRAKGERYYETVMQPREQRERESIMQDNYKRMNEEADKDMQQYERLGIMGPDPVKEIKRPEAPKMRAPASNPRSTMMESEIEDDESVLDGAPTFKMNVPKVESQDLSSMDKDKWMKLKKMFG